MNLKKAQGATKWGGLSIAVGTALIIFGINELSKIEDSPNTIFFTDEDFAELAITLGSGFTIVGIIPIAQRRKRFLKAIRIYNR